MAARKPGLGRGLDALIPQDHPHAGFANISVESISPNPNQPRTEFTSTAIDTLAESIKELGVLQPILVRASGDDYVLVAGERRLRATKQAGLTTIPAVIRPEADEATNLTEALVENLQREDLNPLEQATAFRELLEEHGMTHDELAGHVGRSRSAVTNTVRLLGLPVQIQAMLIKGDLSEGHARALLGADDEAYSIHIAQRAVAEGWTVRRVEEAVRLRATQGATNSVRSKRIRPAAIIELEERLQDRLGTKVSIDYRGKGGKITIKYTSPEDLERIYRHLFEPSS